MKSCHNCRYRKRNIVIDLVSLDDDCTHPSSVKNHRVYGQRRATCDEMASDYKKCGPGATLWKPKLGLLRRLRMALSAKKGDNE